MVAHLCNIPGIVFFGNGGGKETTLLRYSDK